jgi:hypothetical protein
MALLGTARSRNAFVRALAEVRAKYPFALVGYVVMPEHLHLLIAEPEARKPIGSCAQPETARFQANASQGPQEIGFTEIVRISRASHAFPAASVLRFQRMERQEAPRKAGLHASEPGDAAVGDRPQGLGLEQLCLLFRPRHAATGNEFHPLT